MLQKRLSILITNDDGIGARGIQILAEVLSKYHDVMVVAPDQEKSGFSAAITLHRPLKATKIADGMIKVDGTPADCVHLGLRMFMKGNPPDLIVSGINRGPNLGDDTIFSGTVGAANVASLEGFPAIAVSMGDFTEPMHYLTAAEVVARLTLQANLYKVLPGRVLNINVPNVPVNELAGLAETRLGKRFYPDHFDTDKNDDSLVWYGRGHVRHDCLEDSDITAVEQGKVSLTLLKPHLLDIKAYEAEETWQWVPTLDELSLA